MEDYSYKDEFDAHAFKGGGIYAIENEECIIVYIGATKCFMVRFGQHYDPNSSHRPVPMEEVFKIGILAYEDNETERKILERRYIDYFQPKYNSPNAKYHPNNPSDPKVSIYRRRKVNTEHPNRPFMSPYLHTDGYDGDDDELKQLLNQRYKSPISDDDNY